MIVYVHFAVRSCIPTQYCHSFLGLSANVTISLDYSDISDFYIKKYKQINLILNTLDENIPMISMLHLLRAFVYPLPS